MRVNPQGRKPGLLTGRAGARVRAVYTRLAEAMARAGGLLTRGAVLDCGLTPSQITKLINDDVLVVVRRGVYADAEVFASLDEFRGRPRFRARAAVLNLRRGWVMSHDSSALEHGLPLLSPKQSLVHITRPGFSSAWTRYGVKHHYARFRPSQLMEVDGVRVLDVPRTAIDLAREHGEVQGVVACDWALREGATKDQLMQAYLPMDHWPGVPQARSAVDLADPRAENAAETLGRLLVKELGIGEPDPQFPVRIEDGSIAWCDLRVGNHVFEVDGYIKYLPKESGGVADAPASRVVWDEKKRERLVCSEGLGMSRIFYEDFWGDRRAAAKRRLRAEYDVTERRFGPELAPHLASSGAEIRQRHGWRDRARGA